MADLTAAEVAALRAIGAKWEADRPITGAELRVLRQHLTALLDAAERLTAAELSPGRCPRCKETLIRVDPDGDEARRLEMLNAKGDDE